MEMQAGHLQAEPPRHLNGIGPLFAIDAEFGRRAARIDQLFRAGIAGSQAGIDADADLAARTPIADAPEHAARCAGDGEPGVLPYTVRVIPPHTVSRTKNPLAG